MQMNKKLAQMLSSKWCVLIIMALAIFSRLYKMHIFPEGMTPDEAYGAYNAYALMTEGIDSRGYAFPVYFIAWGSGMSVLYSYLAIPCFWLFGTAAWVYRIPQVLIGIGAVYAMYKIACEVLDEKFGLFVAFILAINPWHIMNNRYGLDANMAPSMLTIAVCFLILGLKKKSIYLIPAAVTLGATLYCYALSWIIIPPILLLGGILFWKHVPKDKYLVAFVGILFVLALPLLLFLGVNLEVIPEIRTNFFSIPKLDGFRGEELDFTNIKASFRRLIEVVLFQYDGINYTSSKLVGAYYYVTSPFFVFGILYQIADVMKKLIKKEKLHSGWTLWMFLWFVCAGISFTINANITIIHINLIHIPVIFYGAYGIYQLAHLAKSNLMIRTVYVFLIFSFVIFFVDYSQTKSTYFFGTEASEAIETAKEKAEELDTDICIVGYPTIKYSILLWHEKPGPEHFSKNAVYTGDPSWAELESYKEFHYVDSIEKAVDNDVYIIYSRDMYNMAQKDFAVENINATYAIAWK